MKSNAMHEGLEMSPKEMVCIVCPMGCRLTVQAQGDAWVVTGNKCNRGAAYAAKEMTNPTRMVPTTVAISHSLHGRLPVKTAEPIPKALIRRAMDVISEVTVEAPVELGDIIVKDLLGTGVDVVATRGMDRV